MIRACYERHARLLLHCYTELRHYMPRLFHTVIFCFVSAGFIMLPSWSRRHFLPATPPYAAAAVIDVYTPC